MNNQDKVIGFINAGGKSKRFGQDKSLYIFEDKPMIQHVYEALEPVFTNISILGDKNKYNFMDIKVYEDIIPDLGPIGGLYTALKNSDNRKIFLIACDMPFVNPEFIQYMTEITGDYDIVIPVVNGKYEPLHAIYSPECLPVVEEMIRDNKLKLTGMFGKLNTREVNEEEMLFYDDPEKMFCNINYIEEVETSEIAGV